MKALVYHGPGNRALEDKPKPEIQAPTDAIVKITKTTIYGTDLHILKGDVPTVTERTRSESCDYQSIERLMLAALTPHEAAVS